MTIRIIFFIENKTDMLDKEIIELINYRDKPTRITIHIKSLVFRINYKLR